MSSQHYNFARLKQVLKELNELTVPSETVIDADNADYVIELKNEVIDLVTEIEKAYGSLSLSLLEKNK
jgi:hypothetical protein